MRTVGGFRRPASGAFLKLDADEIPAIVAEPKIDGLSLSLRYENGETGGRAATRGDGTNRRRRYRQCPPPSRISPNTLEGTKDFRRPARVRGEIYMLEAGCFSS